MKTLSLLSINFSKGTSRVVMKVVYGLLTVIIAIASIFFVLPKIVNDSSSSLYAIVDLKDGWYYGIVYSDDRKVAQFSYPFEWECDTVDANKKLSGYADKNNFKYIKLEGPFNSNEAAEKNRADAKVQWKNSTYKIGGDNNFFGNCYK